MLFKSNVFAYEFELNMDSVHYHHMPSGQFLNYIAVALNYCKWDSAKCQLIILGNQYIFKREILVG